MTEASRITPLDPDLAAQLIFDQFPELAGCDIRHQASMGTDNHIYRIGETLCARFPKVAWAGGTAAREAAILPRFAGSPLSVPSVYGLGVPVANYPHAWSVLSWLPGTPLEGSALGDPDVAGRQLADFFSFVRSAPVDPAFAFGPENNGRGAPLAARTTRFGAARARLPGVDPEWASRLWSQALATGKAEAACWLHGDVHPGNILLQDGRLTGVIDWGLGGVGDAACDLLTAWAVFDRAPREVFRRAIGASDAEWLRGAGWALSMAVIYLPYAYEHGLRSDMSEKMIARLKEEFA